MTIDMFSMKGENKKKRKKEEEEFPTAMLSLHYFNTDIFESQGACVVYPHCKTSCAVI